MMKEKKKDWKLSKTDKKDIECVLTDLLEICQILHLPMFACVITEYGEDGIVYDNIIYSAQSHKINLYDDCIRRHMLVANGFEVSYVGEEDIEKQKENKIPQEDLPLSKRYTVYHVSNDSMEELDRRIGNVMGLSEKYDTSVFISVAIDNTDECTVTKSCHKIPKSQKTLKDNLIMKHIQIADKGFDAVPARDLLSIDMDDIFGGGIGQE